MCVTRRSNRARCVDTADMSLVAIRSQKRAGCTWHPAVWGETIQSMLTDNRHSA
jgi:hypothetical protein